MSKGFRFVRRCAGIAAIATLTAVSTASCKVRAFNPAHKPQSVQDASLKPGALLSDGSQELALLRSKLDHQWALYDAARAELVSKVAKLPDIASTAASSATSSATELTPMSRETWESMLTPKGNNVFTAEDLATLRKAQTKRIAMARTQAQSASLFDLDLARSQKDLTLREKTLAAFCQGLPKGGMLHVHANGTVDQKTAESLLARFNPKIPFPTLAKKPVLAHEAKWLESQGTPKNYSELNAAEKTQLLDFFVLPTGPQPFGRFLVPFDFVKVARVSQDAEAQIHLDFAKRAISQRVRYAEVTVFLESDQTTPHFFEKLAEEIEKKTGLVMRYRMQFVRTSPAKYVRLNIAKIFPQMDSPAIVGIDFVGDETNAPALESGQLIYASAMNWKTKDGRPVRRSMHAGELGDPRNTRDAMILGAERLGHGIALATDPIALQYAAERGVGVEVNLISNLRLAAVSDMRSHPFLNFLRLGVPVSLSTDDEGIFQTDMNTECRTAVEGSDVTYAEFKAMAQNSLKTAFVDAATKVKLEQALKEDFESFESQFAKAYPALVNR